MSTPSTGDQAVPVAPERGVALAHAEQTRRAAGIYGTVVTASVLASAGAYLRTWPLAAAVLVTLVVYWLAEEYAEFGAAASSGRLPSRQIVWTTLKAKWSMVTASYIPVVAMLITRAFGATTSQAAYVGLAAAAVMLMIFGGVAARASGMRGLPLLIMTLIAGGLGALMVLLKVAIVHLH
jgi:hypothetical protein